MSNMSYCRFQNTLSDLDDCNDDLDRRTIGEGEDEDGDPMEPLSDREERAAAQLIGMCVDIVQRVMDERGLESMDEVTPSEIMAYIDELQKDVQQARDRRALLESCPARRGDFVVVDGTPVRVVDVIEDVDADAVTVRLADGRELDGHLININDVKLESEVGVVRS